MIDNDVVCFSRSFGSLSERSRLQGTDFKADVRALGKGPHRAHLSCVDSGEVRILAVHDRGGVQMRGAVHDGALVAVFLWGDDTQLNGRRQDVPRLLLLGPGTEVTTTQPGEYRCIRVGLRGAALGRVAANASLARGAAPWLQGGVFQPRCTAAAEWRLQQSILWTLRFAGAAELYAARPTAAIAAAVECVAHNLVAAVGTGADGDTSRLPAPARLRLVTGALELLHATPDEPVSVSSVCDGLGVTERALQRAFQDCLGISLRAYARERRLRAVHGAILAEGDRRSITDIAMSFGFWHLGRFSGAYAALFGCLPTETRRRVWREIRSDAAEPPTSPLAFVQPGGRRARPSIHGQPWRTRNARPCCGHAGPGREADSTALAHVAWRSG